MGNAAKIEDYQHHTSEDAKVPPTPRFSSLDNHPQFE